ncbi:hypothetical protein OG866_44060 [Streptomyces sp. NBC_00663]|uniref:hypothetical protein n=1 Tax=Streptomyces sp. NBC_00663 TaxID=2975801 RepID=UPI002E2FD68B|nr:hypothetical protein [Streptomyces sp. NBC_00663]
MHTSFTDPTSTDSTQATDEEGELERQKAAVSRLGHELRVLVEATVRTAASPDTLHRVADGVRHVAGQLTGRRRSRAEIPEVDEFPAGARMYSPVTGAGSPLAPPVLVTPTADGLMGHCTLGIAHEGPPRMPPSLVMGGCCQARLICRLPPAACRLPPAACRLPPAACRLPPASARAVATRVA